ncbi:MAG: M14 family zinc carboxypeptidase [Planctomycetota bacterium]
MRLGARRLMGAWVVVVAVVWAGGVAHAAPWGTWDGAMALIDRAAEAGHVERRVIGRSVEGRPIVAVRVAATFPEEADREPVTVVLLVGLQHGDEPAGGRAMLDLIAEVGADRSVLPGALELHVVPILNPDGAVVDGRRNAAGFDLNRDHHLVSQPETAALHAYVREVRPHVVVDGHEFNRTTGDYAERGWTEWPLVTLGVCQSPLHGPGLSEAGRAVLDAVAPAMDAAGVNFAEYLVGDAPGVAGGELRPSTLDTDDCRNGLAMHGAVGFIVESGIKRSADDPHADLAERVAGYRVLLDAMLGDESRLAAMRDAAEAARAAELGDVLPVDFLWARRDARATGVRVIDAATGATVEVAATNVMDTAVVKRLVAVPRGYAVRGKAAVSEFAALLDRHGIGYAVVGVSGVGVESEAKPRAAWGAEVVELVAMEAGYDARYHRYGGRQITAVREAGAVQLGAGALVVDLDALVVDLDALGVVEARRAAALLEPQMTYGLYQWPAFASLVGDDGVMPVIRLLEVIDEPAAVSAASPGATP